MMQLESGWKLNEGKGIPSDFGGKVLYSNGLQLISPDCYTIKERWDIEGDLYIYAYLSTQKKGVE